jgi:DNA-binding response OmpR family regulator
VNRGAGSYIVKPFRTDDLLNTVKEHEETTRCRKQGEEKVRGFIGTRAAGIERQR